MVASLGPRIQVREIIGSKQGWSPAGFHEYCDDKGPTITVFKSSAGKVFGGFASVSWESRQDLEFVKDDKAFIFSLDLKRIFKPNDEYNALKMSKFFGPCFGGN